MGTEKTVNLGDGETVQVEVRKLSEGGQDKIHKPASALGEKRNFEKKVTKPKRPPIPRLFQPEGPPTFIQDAALREDVKGIAYHSSAIKLKRNMQRRKRSIVLNKVAPPTTIPQTHRSKSMLWLM